MLVALCGVVLGCLVWFLVVLAQATADPVQANMWLMLRGRLAEVDVLSGFSMSIRSRFMKSQRSCRLGPQAHLADNFK